jgi:hypothetical protein
MMKPEMKMSEHGLCCSARPAAEKDSPPGGYLAGLADSLSISRDAVALLALHDFQPDTPADWNAFLLAAISEFVIHDTRPGGPAESGEMRVIVPSADFAMLRAISDRIDPALIDSEWKEFLGRALPGAEAPKASRWLRVSDDIFAKDEVAT